METVKQQVRKISKEVREALKRVKNGKAVGLDDKPIEVWKFPGGKAVEFLHIHVILDSEKMPEELGEK